MSTLAEIEAAVATLSPAEMRQLEDLLRKLPGASRGSVSAGDVPAQRVSTRFPAAAMWSSQMR